MSGKFNKKNIKRGKQKNRKALWVLCAVLYALLIALLLFLVHLKNINKDPDISATDVPSVTTAPEQQQKETQPSGGNQSAESPKISSLDGFDLGSGVIVTGSLPYTGAFMEDRTDEVVTDVLAIRVTNTGDKFIQTMNITLTDGDVEAVFSLTTLFPGQTMVVLEKNRMAYSSAPDFTHAQASAVALFDSNPRKYEDMLEIQCLDGVINITNISGEDITGDILVYYKNYVGGIYYGGITYRLRIEDGLKAGEVRQGFASHFNPDNSVVAFVTCG